MRHAFFCRLTSAGLSVRRSGKGFSKKAGLVLSLGAVAAGVSDGEATRPQRPRGLPEPKHRRDNPVRRLTARERLPRNDLDANCGSVNPWFATDDFFIPE